MAVGKSEAANVTFEVLARTGHTAEAIAQVAREEDIDHIVMGDPLRERNKQTKAFACRICTDK